MNNFKFILTCIGNILVSAMWVAFYALLQVTVFTWSYPYKNVAIVAGIMVLAAIAVLILSKNKAYVNKLIEWPILVTIITILISAVTKLAK